VNSKERVINRIKGEKVDRIPNLSIVMQFAAKLIGVKYGDFCTDYKKLAEGMVMASQKFGIDAVSVISDPVRETAGFGAEIIIPEDGIPHCAGEFIKEYGDIKKLKVFDPVSRPRTFDRIKGVERIKELISDEFAVLGWIEAPFAEACDLRGINNIMFDIMDEPEFVKEMMEITLEQGILFAGAQIEAGADIIGIGDAASSLLGRKLYEQFVFDYQKRIIEAVHEMGAYAKLHICGNTAPILDLLPKTGADVIDIDHMVDFQTAVDTLNKGACACGNFDPVGVLLMGTPEAVDEAVRGCISSDDGKIIIAAGCEVPVDTPLENVKQINDTLLKY